jgi:hypothetical protein
MAALAARCLEAVIVDLPALISNDYALGNQLTFGSANSGPAAFHLQVSLSRTAKKRCFTARIQTARRSV